MTRPVRVLNLFELSAEHNARLRAVSSRLEVVQVDDSLLDNLNEPEAEVVFASSPPPAHGTPRLRWLQVSSAGIDHMAKSTIWSRDVTVTNARGVYSVAMAEYVMSAVLSVSQRMDDRRALQTARHWPAYGEFCFARPRVVGRRGTVGRETARLAKAFGMRVVAVKAHPGKPEDESFRQPGTGDPDGTLPERIVGFEGLSDVLQEADYLVVTVPLTPNTDGLITRQLLEQVRPTTWLINVSRGKVIDESALIECLRQGRMAGASLDVFAAEPLPSDSELWALPNVSVTPHVAGGGAEGASVLTDLCCENLRRYLAGERLLNVVRPELGY